MERIPQPQPDVLAEIVVDFRAMTDEEMRKHVHMSRCDCLPDWFPTDCQDRFNKALEEKMS